MSHSSRRWPPLSTTLLRTDILAGLVLGLLLVPQSLAYATLAGMPPVCGLYAALLPAVIGALAGWCNQLQTGPVAMTAMLVTATLTPLAEPGSPAWIAYASLLAVMVGGIRIGLGLLRAADATRLISSPVLSGFTSAASLVIICTQLPAMLGITARTSAGPWATLHELYTATRWEHPAALVMGIACLTALVILRIWPRLHGAVIVVLLSIVFSVAGWYPGPVVGTLPDGLPSLSMPALDAAAIATLLPGAMLVSLIGFAEVLSATRSCSLVTRQSIDLNRELIGQGAASLASAGCGSFPPSGSLSRTALAMSLGARSPIAVIVSAGVVAAVLFGGTRMLAPLPMATLSALVVVAVLPLIDLRAMWRAWRTHPHDGIAGATTFIATVLLAPRLVDGFLAGIAIGVGLLLWRLTRPRIADCSRHPDGTWRDWRQMGLQPSRELAVLRPDARISFASAAAIEDVTLQAFRERDGLRAIILACESVNEVDATGCETLRRISLSCRETGVHLCIAGLKTPVEAIARRSGAIDGIDVYRTTDEAVRGVVAKLGLPPQPWDPATEP